MTRSLSNNKGCSLFEEGGIRDKDENALMLDDQSLSDLLASEQYHTE